MYTVEEYAKKIGKPKREVYRMIEDKKLKKHYTIKEIPMPRRIMLVEEVNE